MGETTASAFQLKNSKGQPSVSRMLTAPKTGILEKIELPEEAEDPDISITLNVQPSDPVRTYQNGRDLLGLVIVKGDSVEARKKRIGFSQESSMRFDDLYKRKRDRNEETTCWYQL